MSVALITGAGQGHRPRDRYPFSMWDAYVVIADVHGANACKVQEEIQNVGKSNRRTSSWEIGMG
jgi:predicted nucleic acid-binding protein